MAPLPDDHLQIRCPNCYVTVQIVPDEPMVRPDEPRRYIPDRRITDARERFAAAALTGLLNHGCAINEVLARTAWKAADMMLAEEQ